MGNHRHKLVQEDEMSCARIQTHPIALFFSGSMAECPSTLHTIPPPVPNS